MSCPYLPAKCSDSISKTQDYHSIPPLRRFMGLGSCLLITISGVVTHARVSWADLPPDRVLLAQQVVDGLPPPPLDPYGVPVQPLVPAIAPPNAPVSAVSEQPLQRYLVLVNGNSPLLLEQVRKIESGAFLQSFDGQRVIQAGAFNESARAEQQVQLLGQQGIGAQIVPVTAPSLPMETLQAAAPSTTTSDQPFELVPLNTPPSREVIFGQVPNSGTSNPSSVALLAATTPFYVVVPGPSNDLPEISNQIIRLGGSLGLAREGILQARRSPLGPHVLVGPFTNRRAAERWNDYLRAFGLDARVYYRRS